MTCTATRPAKRGWPAQRERREEESAVRRRAVAFDDWAGHFGLQHQHAARQLGLARGTLAHWRRRCCEDGLAARPLGRPCDRSDPEARNAAIHLMRSVGPQVSEATLRAACPTLARSEVQNLQARFRGLWRKDHQRLLHVLHWQRPGTVWAMDHTEPSQPIDGFYRYILNVRDLASGLQLAWRPVEDETAELADYTLETLFHQYGPPLVLKCDNGSPFIADETLKLLDHWNVFPLFSPPRTPQYNGACEASHGAMHILTEHQAARQGRPACCTCDDLEAARWFANELHRPSGHRGPTPREVWDQRPPITETERAAFGRSLQQHRETVRFAERYTLDVPLGRQAQAKLDRVAISRALVELGFLTFTRRSITPPIPSHLVSRIS
jgi:transposase InsO family protein